MTDINEGRRKFIRNAALFAAAVPFAGMALRTPQALAEMAKAENGHALDYVNDATNSDNEKHTDGSHCEKCVFWSGEKADGWGNCLHPKFNDVLVNANGWCSAYVKKG